MPDWVSGQLMMDLTGVSSIASEPTGPPTLSHFDTRDRFGSIMTGLSPPQTRYKSVSVGSKTPQCNNNQATWICNITFISKTIAVRTGYQNQNIILTPNMEFLHAMRVPTVSSLGNLPLTSSGSISWQFWQQSASFCKTWPIHLHHLVVSKLLSHVNLSNHVISV